MEAAEGHCMMLGKHSMIWGLHIVLGVYCVMLEETACCMEAAHDAGAAHGSGASHGVGAPQDPRAVYDKRADLRRGFKWHSPLWPPVREYGDYSSRLLVLIYITWGILTHCHSPLFH